MARDGSNRPAGGERTLPGHAGRTRWERMERHMLTLERLSALHASAYRAENKSEATVAWHREAIAPFATWVTRELDEVLALRAFTLDNVREYVAELRLQTCWQDVEAMPEAARERLLSDGRVSWHVRGLRAFASWLYAEGYT